MTTTNRPPKPKGNDRGVVLQKKGAATREWVDSSTEQVVAEKFREELATGYLVTGPLGTAEIEIPEGPVDDGEVVFINQARQVRSVREPKDGRPRKSRSELAQQLANSAWFKERMADQGMSLRDFARKSGISQAAVSLTINGLRKLQPQELVTYSEMLRVPPDEVLRHLGVELRRGAGTIPGAGMGHLQVEVVGLVYSDGHVEDVSPGNRGRKVRGPGAGDGLAALRIEEGAMEGWVMFHRARRAAGVDPEAAGRLCVVEVKGWKGSWLQWVRRGWETGAWALTGLDGDVEEDRELISATPILWAKQ